MDPVRRATYSDNASTRQAAGRRSLAGPLRSLTRRTRLQTCRPSTSESLDQHALPDEALDMERDVRVQQWKTLARARPLKFLVAGRGGMGKSSLVNNLLDLDRSGEEGAKEGFTGRATTQAVSKHTGSKHGIEVIAYDTPGFQDLTLREEDIIAELVDTTDSMLDVCLYCASLETRISQEDRRICSLLTNAFKPTLWEKAIFVLTFANSVSTKVDKGDYEALVDCYKTSLQQCLLRAGVPADMVNNIPFCTVGYTDPQLICEDCSNWQDRLYVEIIQRADPEVTPALLKLRWGPGAVRCAMGGGVAGAVSGAAVGAGIGAGVGILGGPVGLPIGAAVGGLVGAATGAIVGPVPATGMRALMSEDLKTIVKAKYALWKNPQKKHNVSKCRQQ